MQPVERPLCSILGLAKAQNSSVVTDEMESDIGPGRKRAEEGLCT